MGEGKLTPVITPTPLNRQSRNIAHVITSTLSPHKPHLVKIAPGVTSPHIAKVTTQFLKNFFLLCTQNLSTDLELRPLNRFCHAIHQQTRIPLEGQKTIFYIFTFKTPKTPFWGTYNGKPMGNTYSHNCMMHRDTMLKFGMLFDLAKYFEQT